MLTCCPPRAAFAPSACHGATHQRSAAAGMKWAVNGNLEEFTEVGFMVRMASHSQCLIRKMNGVANSVRQYFCLIDVGSMQVAALALDKEAHRARRCAAGCSTAR